MTSGPEQEMHPCIHHPHRCLRMTLTTLLYFTASVHLGRVTRDHMKNFLKIYFYTLIEHHLLVTV